MPLTNKVSSSSSKRCPLSCAFSLSISLFISLSLSTSSPYISPYLSPSLSLSLSQHLALYISLAIIVPPPPTLSLLPSLSFSPSLPLSLSPSLSILSLRSFPLSYPSRYPPLSPSLPSPPPLLLTVSILFLSELFTCNTWGSEMGVLSALSLRPEHLDLIVNWQQRHDVHIIWTRRHEQSF